MPYFVKIIQRSKLRDSLDKEGGNFKLCTSEENPSLIALFMETGKKEKTMEILGKSQFSAINISVLAGLKGTSSKNIERLSKENFSAEFTESSLGSSFTYQIIRSLIVAFILMAIVVFITFRVFVPGLAVIFAAIFDIIVSMGFMNILGIKLSIPTAAALLLLIGYSVDTDILLTTRILKRKASGSLNERIFESIKTGTTMTFSAIGALLIGYLVTNSFVMESMFLVIIMGLVADLFSTWLVNVYILKLYVERREKNG